MARSTELAALPVGAVVALHSAQGLISRVVVEDYGDIVSVCLKEEFAAAQRERRKPLSVGFRKRDIVKRIS